MRALQQHCALMYHFTIVTKLIICTHSVQCLFVLERTRGAKMLPICYKSPCSPVDVFTAWTENSALFQCCTPLLISWYCILLHSCISDHNGGKFECILFVDSGSAYIHSSDLCICFFPSIVKFWYLLKILHKLYFTAVGCTDASSVYIWNFKAELHSQVCSLL